MRKDGQPLANATIYLEQVAPSSAGSSTDSRELIVVTDASGHFNWKVPADRSVVPNVNAAAPKCWVLPADRSAWDFSVRAEPHWTQDGGKAVLESATRECTTRWIQKGDSVLMVVTAPDMAAVTMSICDPDGRPLRSHALQVFPVGTSMDGFGAVIYDGKTNRDGAVTMRCFTGVTRLQAFVPGVGFLSTGSLDLRAGKEVVARVPRLGPFGRISGSLAGTAIGGPAGLGLEEYGYSEHRWYRPAAQIDASGNWEISDLLPGQHRLVVKIDGKTVNERQVTVGMGESLTGIRLTSQVAAKAPPRTAYSPSPTSIEGTVTDSEGHLAATVVVYAVCPNNQMDGWSEQQVLKSTTDDHGRYIISGLPGMRDALSVRLVAARKGSGIAEASPQPLDGAAGTHARADLVLSPEMTGLTVRVLNGGVPVANAAVSLSSAGDSVLEPRYSRFHATEDLGEVRRLLEPSGVTNADGRVTIRGLFPGLWNIAATDSADASSILEFQGSISWPPAARSATALGIARNIPVDEGKTNEFSLDITNLISKQVAFRVLGPDGRPPAELTANIESGTAVPSGGGSGPAKLNADGDGIASVGSSGLWLIGARFRDNDMNAFSPMNEPYYFAQTVCAVSPAAPMPERVTLHTMPRGLGSLRIRIEDAAGKPARAAIAVNDIGDSAAYGGSTDGQGNIEFADIPSGNYTISAHLLDLPSAPSLESEGGAFPDDSRLDHTIEITPKFIVFGPGQDSTITLRAEPQGYIRGWLRGADRPADYMFDAITSSVRLSNFQTDPLTGEFIAGPFPAGKVTLLLSRTVFPVSRWQSDVDVAAARVAHLTLVPEGSADAPKPAAASTTLLNMHVSQDTYTAKSEFPLTGTVYLADGITPAWGARIAVSTKASHRSLIVKQTDLNGHPTSDITPRWEPYRFRSPQSLHEPEPDDSLVVVWLPGANGAVVFPYDSAKPIHAVLPAPIELRGRVTLGFKHISGDVSSFCVIADYQGRGRLDRYLSVETTAQADGSFVLAGLTRGTYHVQAVRDGIWLSAAQTLTVGAGTTPPNLTLNIPLPGQPIDLYLTDANGSPLAGAVVNVSRPDGPITDAVWPATFTTDGAGNLHLEGLNAGSETLTLVAAPTNGATVSGSPTRKPVKTFVLDVPLFAAGTPAVIRTIRDD